MPGATDNCSVRKFLAASSVATLLVLAGFSQPVPVAANAQTSDRQQCRVGRPTIAEIEIAKRLDQLREAEGVRPLESSCFLSALTSDWLEHTPEDDTFPANLVARFSETPWRRINMTMRIGGTLDEAWERSLTEGNDAQLFADRGAELVGIAVRVDQDRSWVSVITLTPPRETLEPPQEPAGPFDPIGATIESVLEPYVDRASEGGCMTDNFLDSPPECFADSND